jgi:hypothetical protein
VPGTVIALSSHQAKRSTPARRRVAVGSIEFSVVAASGGSEGRRMTLVLQELRQRRESTAA